MRGTSKSAFEYQIGIKNDSGKKLTVSLSAQAPQNFDTTFTEQYGSQEVNAVPIDAGQTKDIKLKVTPPNTAAAGDYKVTARVSAEDASATDRTSHGHHRPAEGSISAAAKAWSRPGHRPARETSVPVVITNTGTAPRRRPSNSLARPPAAGRSLSIRRPSTASRRTDNKEVQALITPTEKAIAGDYVTTIRALRARGESASTHLPRHGDHLHAVGHCPVSASSALRSS